MPDVRVDKDLLKQASDLYRAMNPERRDTGYFDQYTVEAALQLALHHWPPAIKKIDKIKKKVKTNWNDEESD